MDELEDLTRVIQAHVELALARGELGLPNLDQIALNQQEVSMPAQAVAEALVPTPVLAPAAANGDGRVARLAVIENEVKGCTRCDLHKGRTQTVFSRGNAFAEVVFVGEGPGFNEDQQGLPFVGKAGQLLDRMIAAMGYQPADVYICNVVKCRPPENRTPLPPESAACMPYLSEQLKLVQPKVIVALGRCAAENLGCAGARWRGVWGSWEGIAVMPTYHPAFLLRSPEQKKPVWEDLQKVMQRLQSR